MENKGRSEDYARGARNHSSRSRSCAQSPVRVQSNAIRIEQRIERNVDHSKGQQVSSRRIQLPSPSATKDNKHQVSLYAQISHEKKKLFAKQIYELMKGV